MRSSRRRVSRNPMGRFGFGGRRCCLHSCTILHVLRVLWARGFHCLHFKESHLLLHRLCWRQAFQASMSSLLAIMCRLGAAGIAAGELMDFSDDDSF